MIPGAHLTEAEANSIAYGTFHHAKALNIAYSYAKTDHILILDPDCFILRPNWIEDTIYFMEANEVAFMGTPYHPRRFVNYRYFPTVICMFINRYQLERQNYFYCDFSPVADYAEYTKEIYFPLRAKTYKPRNLFRFLTHRRYRRPFSYKDTLEAIRLCILQNVRHMNVYTYKDTAARLYDYYHDKVKIENLTVQSEDFRRWFEKLFDFFLPDALALFPKKRQGYITNEVYEPLQDYKHIAEYYYWRDEIFAFHITASSYNPESKKTIPLALRDIENLVFGNESAECDLTLQAEKRELCTA
jgi:glycosyltransferase involved in cell wall biosynthesis